METSDVVIKNLWQFFLEYDHKDIIILDSQIYSYAEHKANFIPFPQFTGDESDPTLFYLTNYLLSLSDKEDVWNVISKDLYQCNFQ